MGEYEIQILDSFGKTEVGPGDVGGLYGGGLPTRRSNAAKAPGEWQKFVVDFRAGIRRVRQETARARFRRVTLNGKVIHENVEMKQQTPGELTGKEHAEGRADVSRQPRSGCVPQHQDSTGKVSVAVSGQRSAISSQLADD